MQSSFASNSWVIDVCIHLYVDKKQCLQIYCKSLLMQTCTNPLYTNIDACDLLFENGLKNINEFIVFLFCV